MNFVPTAIQTTEDGGQTYKEQKLEHEVDRDQDRVNETGKSLYEQLEERRLAKEAEDEEKVKQMRASDAPATLDEDDVAFYKEREEREIQRRKEELQQEEKDRQAFALAMASRTVQRASQGTSEDEGVFGKSGLLMQGEAAKFVSHDKPEVEISPEALGLKVKRKLRHDKHSKRQKVEGIEKESNSSGSTEGGKKKKKRKSKNKLSELLNYDQG